MPNRSFRIDLSDDLFPAAYLVAEASPNPATAPRLDTVARPMRLLIDPSREALDDLRRTLRQLGADKPELTQSAALLLAEVERQVAAGGSPDTGTKPTRPNNSNDSAG